MRSLAALLFAATTLTSGCAGRSTTQTTSSAPAREIERATPVVADVAPEAPEPKPGPSPQDGPEHVDGVVHIVQPGQTLWRIARAYDIQLDRLAELNGIPDPARVEVGTPVFIPGARATLDIAPYPAPLPGESARRKAHPEPTAEFLWPVHNGEFMRPFGEPRRRHLHAGVDIRGASGQDILAARDGVVAFGGRTRTGYGTMVVLDHGDGVQTLYAHAKKVLVKQGEAVQRGQAIALLGRTGNATTEHCHFEIRLDNRAVDPMPYLLGTTQAHR